MNALPEMLPEAASDSIKPIYAAICHWSGGALPALIYRHLATYTGVLEEAWQGLEPLFSSGEIPQRAWHIAREHTPRGLMPPVHVHARRVLSLSEADVQAMRNTLESYNRINPVNLLAMLCLLERLQGNVPTQPFKGQPWTAPDPVAQPVPPMTTVSDLDPDVRRLINDLGFGDRASLDPVVPSLYRHFTAWPQVLALFHVNLLPSFRNGSIAQAVAVVREAMRAEAARLAVYLPALQRLPQNPAAVQAMQQFTTQVIPMMIVVGVALAESLADDT